MNRWTDTGAVAVLTVAVVQIGENTIGLLVTAIVVPLAGALWREREKRMTAERDRDKYKADLEEIEDETPDLRDEVRMLRREVEAVRRRHGEDPHAGPSPPRGSELFPYHSRRSTPRRTSSRSIGRSRGSGRGSGGGSGSTTETPT